MPPLIQDILPASSLVGFEARRTAAASTLWSNPALAPPRKPHAYAWCTDAPAGGEAATLLAERHGGVGAGMYYGSVSGICRDGAEGNACARRCQPDRYRAHARPMCVHASAMRSIA